MKGNSYHFRKIHSLLGVIPVGFFLIEHLITNYSAFNEGHQAFADAVEWLNSLPLLLALEALFIWLPLLYHGVYGLYVAYTARNNVTNYGYFRNLMFTLQRITGIITFLFISWHIFQTRVQLALGNVTHEDFGPLMHSIFVQPLTFTLFAIGVISASFHFANGMWSFLVSWGITIGPRAQRVSGYIWIGVFLVMSIMFLLTMVAFTGDEFKDTSTLVMKG